ncbi:MAG: hypothetical protein RR904_01820, partial [Bacilli bacterium]
MENNKNRKNKIGDFLFNNGLVLIMFIFSNVLITSILFLFKISITSINFYVSLSITILFLLYLIKKYNKKHNITNKILPYIFSLIIFFLVLLFSIFIALKYHDATYDGSTYHKSTISALKTGWNPVYSDLYDFDQKTKLKLIPNEQAAIWGNHYTKATWIYSANLYSVTNDIESGKSLNWILCFALFFMISGYLMFKFSYLFAIFIGFLIAGNPIVASQCFTYYVDSLLGLYLFLLIFSLVIFCFNNDKIDKKLKYFLYISSMIMIINIKFTGLAYAGVYCLGFYIYFLICSIKNKQNLKKILRFTIISIITLFVALFIVGISSYCKNYVQKGNPMWPLFGENPIEIMIQNQPDYFQNKTGIEKFLIANFSKTANISQTSGLEASFKVPFTVSDDEINSLANVDNRIGGYGVFYSGILIISLLLICISSIKLYKKDKNLFWVLVIPLLVSIILIFTLTDIWWARYFPQLYLFPIISLIMFNIVFKNNVIKYIVLTIIILI